MRRASELAGKLAAASLSQTVTPEGAIPRSDRKSASAWSPVRGTSYGEGRWVRCSWCVAERQPVLRFLSQRPAGAKLAVAFDARSFDTINDRRRVSLANEPKGVSPG